MANGRALPSALLFDWLLGRAWSMALTSQANASRFGSTTFGGSASESGVSTGSGMPSIEKFLSRFDSSSSAAAVAAHDRALQGQLAEVASKWATEFQGVLSNTSAVGPGFFEAVAWLRKVTNGGDGLGYLGYNQRDAQAKGFANTVVNGLNARGLPTPPGAMAALKGVTARTAGLYVSRNALQMTADYAAEKHKLRIDAVEALIRARDEAMSATMDHVFTQMHLMFDVFGRNNDYLVKMQREEQATKARMDNRSAELAGWNQRILTTDDSAQARNQQIKAAVSRVNTIDDMAAESHIKMLRRYSSRAASALNSAGVSVNSTASESNNIDAGG